jgi:hypothetical protein
VYVEAEAYSKHTTERLQLLSAKLQHEYYGPDTDRMKELIAIELSKRTDIVILPVVHTISLRTMQRVNGIVSRKSTRRPRNPDSCKKLPVSEKKIEQARQEAEVEKLLAKETPEEWRARWGK